MPQWWWIEGLTAWPWYADVVALAGLLSALGWLWRHVVWPPLIGGLRALRAVVIAAPVIAENAPIIASHLTELTELLRADVLVQLERTTRLAQEQEEALDRHERLLDHHGVTLVEHGQRIGRLEGDGN